MFDFIHGPGVVEYLFITKQEEERSGTTITKEQLSLQTTSKNEKYYGRVLLKICVQEVPKAKSSKSRETDRR